MKPVVDESGRQNEKPLLLIDVKNLIRKQILNDYNECCNVIRCIRIKSFYKKRYPCAAICAGLLSSDADITNLLID